LEELSAPVLPNSSLSTTPTLKKEDQNVILTDWR